MNTRLALVIAFLVVLPFGLAAQLAPAPGSGPSVTAAPIAPVTVKQGGSATFEANFRVARGFHINSNHPKDEFLLPTQLKLDTPTDLLIKLQYPEGQDYSFAFAPDQKLNVYTGDFTVKATVNTTSRAAKGAYRVHAILNYQACDNAACYPPKKLPIAFDVRVVAASGQGGRARRNPGQSPHIH